MIDKKKLVNDKFYYNVGDEVLVDALALIDLIISEEGKDKVISKLQNKLDIMSLLLEIKECKEYTRVNLRA
jgi:PIN domain nuclease of toxin-antitoxin system